MKRKNLFKSDVYLEHTPDGHCVRRLFMLNRVAIIIYGHNETKVRILNVQTGEHMGKGKNIAYVRISTLEQNEARQREALNDYNVDKWFIEKAFGKDTNRPKLKEMLEYVREDDTVYVEEFSRLGKSTADLLATVKAIEDAGANFKSLKEKLDSATPAGRLQMTMMAAIAEFERAMILERQREGIAIAKREGKYKGRKPVEVDKDLLVQL